LLYTGSNLYRKQEVTGVQYVEKMFLQNNDNSHFMNNNFIISFVVHS
jgi:hypothetical protein